MKLTNGRRGHFDLLVRHLTKLRDVDLRGALDALEVRIVGRRIPLEEGGRVDEILDQVVIGVAHRVGGLGNLLERSDRGAEDVTDGEGDLAFLGAVEQPDVGQRPQGRRQQAGADVDHSHLVEVVAERVEDLHLIGDLRHVDHLGHLGVEALQRAARRFRIESPQRDIMGAEVVEQRARDGRFAHTAFIGTDENDCWLGHRSHSIDVTDIRRL